MAGKSRRNPVTDEQILESYAQTHSVFVTARALGVGATTAHRVLVRHGVQRDGLREWRENATKFRGQEQKIKEAYETGLTYEQLKRLFGDASIYAYKQALKRAGTVLRENPAPLAKEGEIETIRSMNAAGIGQVPISLALGRSQSFVSRAMKRNSIEPLSNSMKGATHPGWKGGRYKDGSGYIRAWVSDDDPHAMGMRLTEGYVLEHRLVMARKLGRPLLRSETVHHINGDRLDNRPENLELRQGKHGKHVAMCCLDCGSRNIGHVGLEK